VDTREQRVAKNESLFREVNERIKDVNAGLDPDGRHDFLCECGNDDCTAPIPMTHAEYEAVRGHPTRFAIVPGHEVAEIEDVVERYDAYAVVATRAAGAVDVAERTSPRP
jgi:hypothetical protein